MGKKIAVSQIHSSPPIELRVLIAYYSTLAAFFVSSFFPQARLWGINWWAYFPLWVKFALLISGSLIPLLVSRWSTKWNDPQKDISDRAYWLISLGLLVGFGLLFYLLRARTHFLGDGYQLLGTLSNEHFYVKFRNRGSMGLQYLLMNLLGGRSETGALLSYQITSIGAGLLFVGGLIYAARKLLPSNIERLLLVVSVSTGGYMLLFFGYVENYALFVVSVLAYSVVGLLISERKIGRFWILLPQALAVFLHVFGVVLLPATAYLLVAGSPLGNRISSWKTWLKWALAASVVVAVGAAFYYAFTTSYFFRFSLVPIIEDRFTVEGYTLFSVNHLLDFANLIIVLIPGLALLLVAQRLKWRGILSDETTCFLLLASVCALGAAFIFDPKLGMPRDWDVFGFTCIPVLVSLTFFKLKRSHSVSRITIVLFSVVCLYLLIPRSFVLVKPRLTTARLLDFIRLDQQKSERTRFLLGEYLERTHDAATIMMLKSQGWDRLPKAYVLLDDAMRLTDSGATAQAKELLVQVITLRPSSADAWGNLGRCYSLEGHYDSALECFKISDGLNPYSFTCMYNIGQVYFNLKQYNQAIKWFNDALDLEPDFVPALVGLALCYRNTDRWELFGESIVRLARTPGGADEFLVRSIEQLAQRGQFNYATQALRAAIANGLDTVYVRELTTRHPQLDTLK